MAIYINLAANTALLAMKIVVTVLTSSVSVLASLVDGALDFLSTAIVWTTTRLIAQQDQYKYPVGRRRLEPIGVLVFSVIMVTSFVQVALEGLNRLMSDEHRIVQLSIAAVVIMASTVVIKFACWLWCRFINNSSVQALAQDAMTDVVFNIFSIIFPLSKLSICSWAGLCTHLFRNDVKPARNDCCASQVKISIGPENISVFPAGLTSFRKICAQSSPLEHLLITIETSFEC